jgi:hypothetical protein
MGVSFQYFRLKCSSSIMSPSFAKRLANLILQDLNISTCLYGSVSNITKLWTLSLCAGNPVPFATYLLAAHSSNFIPQAINLCFSILWKRRFQCDLHRRNSAAVRWHVSTRGGKYDLRLAPTSGAIISLQKPGYFTQHSPNTLI